ARRVVRASLLAYTTLFRSFARCRHRGQGPSVKAVLERDDLVRPGTPHPAPLARKLDSTFVGFGTAVGKKHPIKARSADQTLGQVDGRLIVESGGRIDKLPGLCGDRFDQWRGAMPQRRYGPTLNKIQVPLSGVVFK